MAFFPCFIDITIRGARYYRYTDKPRCGLEKIRIAIRFWSYLFTRESSLVSVKVNDNCQQRSGECVGRMKITRL